MSFIPLPCPPPATGGGPTPLPEFDSEIVILCDDNGGFLRRFTYDESTGLPTTTATTDFDGNPYAPVGTVHVCDQTGAAQVFVNDVVLCDDNGPFLRKYLQDAAGATTGVVDFTLAGVPYVVTGAVVVCPVSVAVQPPEFDVEEEVIYDGPDDHVGFIRRYVFDSATGNVVSTTDLDLNGNPYVPVNTVRADPTEYEYEEEVLCDDNGPFIRRFSFDTQTQAFGPVTDFDLAGAPYVAVGTVIRCPGAPVSFLLERGCLDLNTANNFFANFPANTAAWEYSDDAGGTYSSPAPAVVPQSPGTPRGQQRYRQIFTIPVGATGTFDVTVSGDIYDGTLNDPAEVFYDAVSQGTVNPLGGPDVFTFPATPGVHTFELWTGANDVTPGGLTAPVITATYANNGPFQAIEIVKTVNNTTGNITAVRYFDSSGTELFPSPNQVTIGDCPAPTPDPTDQFDFEQQVLCDANGRFLRTYQYTNGVLTAAIDTDFQTFPYVPVPPVGACPEDCCPIVVGNGCTSTGSGTYVAIRNPDGSIDLLDPVDGTPVLQVNIVPCPETDQIDVEEEILCDDNGPFIRRFTFTNGVAGAPVDLTLAGAPYVVVGPVVSCTPTATDQFDVELEILCDNNGPFLRAYHYTNGVVTAAVDTDFQLGPYVPVGPITVCATDPAVFHHVEQLCDANGTFLRKYIQAADGTVTAVVNTDMDGNPYVPVLPIGGCDRTSETVILCDDNGQFRRTFVYDGQGNVVEVKDSNMQTGAPYVTVGLVFNCTPVDAEYLILCDDNGPFIRRIPTFVIGGNQGTPSNQTMDGSPYTPVGTIKDCGTPVVLGELCASAPDPEAPPLSFSSGTGTLDFVEGPDNTFTATNFQGSGVDVTIVVDPALGAVMIDGIHLQLNGGGNFPLAVNFSQPVTVRGITFGEMDASFAAETFSDYSIPPTGVTGALTLGPGPTYFTNTTINDGNPDGEVQFNSLTNGFTFNYQGNGLGTWIQGLRFEMPNPATIDQTVIAVKCDGCEGGVAYFNKESGLEVLNPTIVDCPAEAVTLDEPIDVNVLTIPESAAQTRASTAQRQTGAGAIAIPAGRTSVTFVSLAGNPTLQVGAGTPIAVPAGATLTFEVDDRNQTLTDTFTGTGLAGDDFIIITTG